MTNKEYLKQLENQITEARNVTKYHKDNYDLAIERLEFYEQIYEDARKLYSANGKEMTSGNTYPTTKGNWIPKIQYVTKNTDKPLNGTQIAKAIYDRDGLTEKFETIRSRIAPVVSNLITDGQLLKYRIKGTKNDFRLIYWDGWIEKHPDEMNDLEIAE